VPPLQPGSLTKLLVLGLAFPGKEFMAEGGGKNRLGLAGLWQSGVEMEGEAGQYFG